MSEIEGDLDSFAVNPRQYEPLKRFCCGKNGSRPEREVDTMTRDYARGRRKYDVFRVTVERPDRLVGLAAFQPASFSQPVLAQVNGYPYISVIGVSEHFRGRTKGGTRPGDFLLADALRAINAHGRWGATPDVFALVDPHNEPSCKLFERHGFVKLIAPPPENTTDDALFGRPGASAS